MLNVTLSFYIWSGTYPSYLFQLKGRYLQRKGTFLSIGTSLKWGSYKIFENDWGCILNMSWHTLKFRHQKRMSQIQNITILIEKLQLYESLLSCRLILENCSFINLSESLYSRLHYYQILYLLTFACKNLLRDNCFNVFNKKRLCK